MAIQQSIKLTQLPTSLSNAIHLEVLKILRPMKLVKVISCQLTKHRGLCQMPWMLDKLVRRHSLVKNLANKAYGPVSSGLGPFSSKTVKAGKSQQPLIICFADLGVVVGHMCLVWRVVTCDADCDYLRKGGQYDHIQPRPILIRLLQHGRYTIRQRVT